MGNTQITGLKEVGESYLELELTRPKGFVHKSGQYTKLFFPDTPDQPIYLSIASKPGHEKVELCIMVREAAIRKRYLDSYKLKTTLKLAAPEGKFLLPAERESDFVFVAGGSGVSPVRSMLLDVVSESKSAAFLIGARSERDIPYIQEFHDLMRQHPRFKFLACSDKGGDGLFKGHVVELFEHHVSQFPKQASYYLCGPKPMMDAFSAAAEKHGVSASQIFWERY